MSVAADVASAVASGDVVTTRNRLRELDEEVAAKVPVQNLIDAAESAMEKTHWRTVFVSRLRAQALAESVLRKYGVLASEFAPPDIERYRVEVVASFRSLLVELDSVAASCAEFRSSRAHTDSAGYAQHSNEVLVKAFAQSITESVRALTSSATVVLDEEAATGHLPRLAKFHDFLSSVLADAKSAHAFVKPL